MVCDPDLCSAMDALSDAILDRNRTAPRGAVPQSVNVCLLRSDTDAAGNSGKMCLEGIVSKRLSAPYRSGTSRDWIKVKNPDSPAMIRAREAE
jgi:hypothetical protein